MLKELKKETNKTFTENGAVTNISTFSDCLDLFATIGALRSASDQDIIDRFYKAFVENSNIAMKILFYARDIRGGLGERRVFRVIINWLANNFANSASIPRNIQYIPEFGRYDDLLSLIDTECFNSVIELIKNQLNKDIDNLKNNNKNDISLLAKWLPSINASSKVTVNQARTLAKALGLSEPKYRKLLSKLRKEIDIIENYLRTKDYSFDYSKQPSKAMLKYQKAFIRNDNNRYNKFLEAVKSGKSKLNTGTLMPYDIIRPIISDDWYSNYNSNLSNDDKAAMDITWNQLEDFTNGENALVVIDGSGSMYCRGNPIPATVALSLGIYYAERNKGEFHNHFITFSNTPKLVEIKGKDIYQKVTYCMRYNEVANTDIEAVFDLILNTAIKNCLTQEELPSTVYIISDMEFDSCTDNADITNFEYAKDAFERNGYKLPNLVFWNVDARNTQQPVTKNDQGVILVSGCNARLFSMVTSGDINPYSFMMDIINSDRYSMISA